MYHKFRHDYYSKTYPRYESYSDVENKRDLVDLIETIHNNEMVEFKQTMYHNPDGSINEYFSSSVASVVSNSISTELSAPIIQQITMILSSPDVSVALSAPVVNLIANSKEIHAQTVNVVASALIDNQLSNQMVSAVSTAITDSRMIDPFVSVISSERVNAVVVNNVGDALSSNRLSVQLEPAVGKVLSTDNLSVQVIAMAENGIQISSITGGSQYSQAIDKDGDGNPDGRAAMDHSEVTMIIGGLGA